VRHRVDILAAINPVNHPPFLIGESRWLRACHDDLDFILDRLLSLALHLLGANHGAGQRIQPFGVRFLAFAAVAFARLEPRSMTVFLASWALNDGIGHTAFPLLSIA
jgi:hypothetical protein